MMPRGCHHAARPHHPCQMGAGCHKHLLLRPAAIRATVNVRRVRIGNMRQQRPAQRHVQHLHPPTDKERRRVPLCQQPRQRHLCAIPFGRDRQQVRMIRIAAIKVRVHIRPARHDDPVEPGQPVPALRSSGRQQNRYATRAAHRIRIERGRGVMLVKQRILHPLVPPPVGGDADQRCRAHPAMSPDGAILKNAAPDQTPNQPWRCTPRSTSR